MTTGYCFLSAVAVRKEASHCSEMVNQLLLGDRVEILDRQFEWLKVRSLYDSYEGWVSDKQLCDGEKIKEEDYVVPADNRIIRNNISIIVPAGAQCDKDLLEVPPAKERDIITIARQFIGTPYLWGGRTSMGIDCSGLIQVVYKICGIKLPRDASQQFLCGTTVDYNDIQAGDLAFFANSEGRIVHVGIAVGDGTIIHASGMVRCDRLDSTGIYNDERKEYSHKLFGIKRL